MAKQSVDIVIKAHDKAGKLFGKIGRSFSAMTRKFALGILTKPFKLLGSLISKLITKLKTLIKWSAIALISIGGMFAKWAMDAEESENLFRETFGKMSKTVSKWADTMAEKLGMNAYEIRRNVGILKLMIENMGLSEKEATKLSKRLTILAYDMASFYNIKPEEAFMKLRSGMSGMVAPLRELGISLHEATIKQWALEKGMIKQGETMTMQQKVVARYNVILLATKKAQGDMARTLDTSTNVLRTIIAQIRVLGIEIGKSMLPAITKLAIRFREWLIDSKKQITLWASRVIIEVEFVSGVFYDFLKFMKTDWRSGMQFIWDSFIEGLKLMAKTAINISIGIGKGIKEGIMKGFGLGPVGSRAIGRRVDTLRAAEYQREQSYNMMQKYRAEKEFKKTGVWKEPISFSRASTEELRKKAKKELEREELKKQTKGILEGIFEAIAEDAKEAGKNILAKIPEGFAPDFEKRQAERLKKLADLYGPKFVNPFESMFNFFRRIASYFSEGGGIPGAASAGGGGGGARAGLPAITRGLLTMAPGARLGPEHKTQQNTAKTAKTLTQMLREIKTLIRNTDPNRAIVAGMGIVIGTLP